VPEKTCAKNGAHPASGEVMLSPLLSAAVIGIEASLVEVEVEVSGGLPGLHLVGLPTGAVREGAVRIRSALRSSGFELGSARTTVNLAPADMRKDGGAFDLPIALGILAARRLITISRRDLLIAGERALDGRVRPVRGALSLAEAARRAGLGGVLLPRANAAEAALVEGLPAYGVESLQQAVELMTGAVSLEPARATAERSSAPSSIIDFAEVRGQQEARRAAEVAAAGGHNLMLVGPPGSGKTMIARGLAGVLPSLSRDEAIETTRVHSVAGLLAGRCLVEERPFRAPHHTCSSAGLVGGGSSPRPGEVSLAHNGVLFLDELPEFPRGSLEALRQPLEERKVTVVRARQSSTFPASFMLVAAMNPCPCGYRGSRARTCTCGEREALRYAARVSGPLLDRFDLLIPVDRVETRELLANEVAETSETIRSRVCEARLRQQRRFAGTPIHCNAQMSPRQIRRVIPLGQGARHLLQEVAEKQGLSGRALHRACRVARTIADLENQENVSDAHLLEALSLQRGRWIG
jgi:magnesium chelatase family protein